MDEAKYSSLNEGRSRAKSASSVGGFRDVATCRTRLELKHSQIQNDSTM